MNLCFRWAYYFFISRPQLIQQPHIILLKRGILFPKGLDQSHELREEIYFDLHCLLIKSDASGSSVFEVRASSNSANALLRLLLTYCCCCNVNLWLLASFIRWYNASFTLWVCPWISVQSASAGLMFVVYNLSMLSNFCGKYTQLIWD